MKNRVLFIVGLLFAATPLASPPVALALGLMFGLFFTHPFRAESRKISKYLLQLCVVGLGFGMNLQDVLHAGRAGFAYTAAGIAFALAFGLLLGKWLHVKTKNAFLIAVGTAIENFIGQKKGARLGVLREMYREWPFFRSMISNIEMALAKTDFQIARQYAERLTTPELGKRIFKLLEDEYERACRMVILVTDEKRLLEKQPVLQRSITVRNPYVDPMSYLQVELLARLRERRAKPAADAAENDKLLYAILLTINGIAAGMRNTG